VDGANRFHKMWYITWPEIRSTAVILLILAFGGIMSKGYDQILNMTNAVVRDAAETIDTYIYRITFQEKPKYGFSTAIGLSKSVINFAFLLLANKLAKALGEGGIM
jgi:ABC transporter, permease protein